MLPGHPISLIHYFIFLSDYFMHSLSASIHQLVLHPQFQLMILLYIYSNRSNQKTTFISIYSTFPPVTLGNCPCAYLRPTPLLVHETSHPIIVQVRTAFLQSSLLSFVSPVFPLYRIIPINKHTSKRPQMHCLYSISYSSTPFYPEPTPLNLCPQSSLKQV